MNLQENNLIFQANTPYIIHEWKRSVPTIPGQFICKVSLKSYKLCSTGTVGGGDTDLSIGIGTLLASECLDNIDKSPVVLDTALGSASLLLLLLLLLHFRSLVLHFTSTGQRTVDLAWMLKGNVWNMFLLDDPTTNSIQDSTQKFL